MAKFMKVVKIILISLLVFVLVGYVVLYMVNPELARQIMATVVDYANRPLPIIGVSSVVVAILVWKIFSSTIYGKKALAQMKLQYEMEAQKIRNEYEQEKMKYASIITFYENELDVVFDSVVEMCNASGNKKVKAIGEKLNTDVQAMRVELKEKFKEIVDSNVELLTKSKEDVVNAIVELVKKELVEKYGEEGQKALEGITETKKI